MQAGEKYLDIKIVGHEFIRCFPNNEKKTDKQPDFKSDGCAIWVRAVKPKENRLEIVKPNMI